MSAAKSYGGEIRRLSAEIDDLRKQVAGILKLIAREVSTDRSIKGFCLRQNISRTHFYKLRRDGKAPRMAHVGGRRMITPQAEREWEIAREQEGAAQL